MHINSTREDCIIFHTFYSILDIITSCIISYIHTYIHCLKRQILHRCFDFVYSWEIAEYPGILAPVHPELKTLLDKEIGPLSRHLVYAFLLKDVNRRHWDMLCTYRRHWLWRFLWWCFVGNTITDRLKKVFFYIAICIDTLSIRKNMILHIYNSYIDCTYIFIHKFKFTYRIQYCVRVLDSCV